MARPSKDIPTRLKQAAGELFAARGPDGTTVDEIARAAGVNRERVYAYFGGKDGLFASVLGDELLAIAGAVPVDAARWRVLLRLVAHHHFLPDGELLAGMPRLAGIPATLIHGRHDISGPLDTAWTLHRAWPGSELVVLDDAGHGGTGFPKALTTALDRYR